MSRLRRAPNDDVSRSVLARSARESSSGEETGDVMNPFAQKTIVVPVDLSDASNYALRFAQELTCGPSNILAIHVGLPFTAVDPPYMYLVDDSTRRGDLEKSVHEHYAAYEGQGFRLVVRYGDPSDQITSYATEVGAGLIVMPSHGRTGLQQCLSAPWQNAWYDTHGVSFWYYEA
jgi:nucleotide-binding universal stress UspA family protein